MNKRIIMIVLCTFCISITGCSNTRDVASAAEPETSPIANQSVSTTQLENPQEPYAEPVDSNSSVDSGISEVWLEDAQENAQESILIYGETYEQAVANGWGDEWLYLASGTGGTDGISEDDLDYFENDTYEGLSSTQITESEIRQINEIEVILITNKWKNDYNKGLPQKLCITNTLPRTLNAKIQYSGPIAIVTTEIEYWLWGKGGSSSGSVYAIVNIDLGSGAILSSIIS